MTIQIPKMFTEEITLKRKASGSYVNGVWTDSIDSTTTIDASVQPAGDRDFLFLPEGRRENGGIRIYSNESITEGSETGLQKGDIVTWNGKNWEVLSTSYWRTPYFHWRAICAGVDPT